MADIDIDVDADADVDVDVDVNVDKTNMAAPNTAGSAGDGERYDIAVIGTGLAGYLAAIRATQKGARVVLVGTGAGATGLSAGVVDIAHYPVEVALSGDSDPTQCLMSLLDEHPNHPYHTVAPRADGETPTTHHQHVLDLVSDALTTLVEMGAAEEGSQYCAGLYRHLILPTALGTLKPTGCAPASMAAGHIPDLMAMEDPRARVLLVDIEGLAEIDMAFVARGLQQLTNALYGDALDTVSTQIASPIPRPPPRPGRGDDGRDRSEPARVPHDLSSIVLARRLDEPRVAERLLASLEEECEKYDCTHIALPPILGYERHGAIYERFRETLGRPVFELVTPPPSIGGLRLLRMLERAANTAGATVVHGHVIGSRQRHGRVETLTVRRGAEEFPVEADAVVLATGRFIAGGLGDCVAPAGGEAAAAGPPHTLTPTRTPTHTHTHTHIRECLFGLPLYTADGRLLSSAPYRPALVASEPFPATGQNFAGIGLMTDDQFRPLRRRARPNRTPGWTTPNQAFSSGECGVQLTNVHACGSILSGYNWSAQRCGLGVALATGYRVGTLIGARYGNRTEVME